MWQSEFDSSLEAIEGIWTITFRLENNQLAQNANEKLLWGGGLVCWQTCLNVIYTCLMFLLLY